MTKSTILQYSSIGSHNGSAPTRRQPIFWINDGKFTDAYMRHSVSMSWISIAFINTFKETLY